MNIINFFGSTDKSDLLLYIGKCLMVASKKVMIIDQTLIKKYRYSVPTTEELKDKDKYITTYEGVDVAIGFNSYEDIEKYLHDIKDSFESYDYIFLDIDTPESYKEFSKRDINSNYMVIDFEKMTLSRAVDILREITSKSDIDNKPIITKLTFVSYLPTVDQNYIQTLLRDFNVEWNIDEFEIQYNEADREINIMNQYSNKLLLRKHTGQYKNTVIDIASLILGGLKTNYINKLLDIYERGKK